MLRQQIKPSHRVHGTLKGKDWAANGARLLSSFAVRAR